MRNWWRCEMQTKTKIALLVAVSLSFAAHACGDEKHDSSGDYQDYED
jgi:hypothetical protein